MGYIYKITNDVNNLIYVGQTICSIETRWKRHLAAIRYLKTDLSKAMLKLGSSHFNISIIEECPNNQLNEKERYWINYYDSYNNGYNMTHGGGVWRGNIEDEILTKEIYNLWDEGYAIAEIEEELELSKTVVSDRIYTYKNYSKEEAIKRGIELTSQSKYKEVYQWDFEGNLIAKYNSLKEASEKNNFSYKALSYAITHQGSSNNFLWSYNNIFPSKASTLNQKKVAQYDLQGKLIHVYNSRTEAALAVGTDVSSISKCCNEKRKTVKGYIWKNYNSNE